MRPGTSHEVRPVGFPPAEAVVFDCDGTLIDTQPCVRAAVLTAFARRGRVCPPGLHDCLVGVSLQDMAREVAALLGESPGPLAAELHDGMVAAVPAHARLVPGARDLVRATAGRLPVAIASNSPRALLTASLSKARLTGLVPITLSADDVMAPKPAPDLYLAACAALRADPRGAVAVEDSPTGVRAARAAGLTVVGVGPRLTPDTVDVWSPTLEALTAGPVRRVR
ncbi:HAD family phosphatase [Nonomuraea sp. NBC_01738]|uniref:HAD family hydrolase n=1 Tax=Nonomuraea sp. NBC_01738 TaxID=2976003 RepID=UPI002E13C62C|nr:HAD family phosphatase [Nonomuraea sp. NBC_01738]